LDVVSIYSRPPNNCVVKPDFWQSLAGDPCLSVRMAMAKASYGSDGFPLDFSSFTRDNAVAMDFGWCRATKRYECLCGHAISCTGRNVKHMDGVYPIRIGNAKRHRQKCPAASASRPEVLPDPTSRVNVHTWPCRCFNSLGDAIDVNLTPSRIYGKISGFYRLGTDCPSSSIARCSLPLRP
jgi:hypothetical protein